MRVILSGGGTGGHIYPAIAIANRIKKEFPKAEILFIGTERGLERELVLKAGYDIRFIPVSYLKRKISLHNVKSAGKLLMGLLEARKIIKRFKPDIVIGTGGFVCGPVLYMASKLRIKTLIHEQNVFPGLTNRILSSYVDRIAISFPEAERYFKEKLRGKLVVTGNPIRDEFLQVSAIEANKRYKPDNRPIVLIVGGSGGSSKLNAATIAMLKQRTVGEYRIILVTGKMHFSAVLEALKDCSAAAGSTILPYINDMPHALRACDLIVCSAGAITIAEVTAAGKPSILIPKAHTAENHQEYNARAMEKAGAAIMLKENQLKGDVLYKAIESILVNKEVYSNMRTACGRVAKIDAIDLILSEVITLIS